MGSMGITKPTPGGSTDTWGQDLNDDVIDVVEEHDHTSGNGVPVPSAGLNIDAALSFGGNEATSVGAVGFADAQTGSIARSLFVDAAHELHWRTHGGVDVQLTNGAGLDATLVGGITGDYTTTDADVEYVDSTKAYEFKQDESPDHFAGIFASRVVLFEETAGVIEGVGLKSPAALATSYNVTFPSTLPGGTALLAIGTTGTLTAPLRTFALPSRAAAVRCSSAGVLSAEIAYTVSNSWAGALTASGWTQDTSNAGWTTNNTGTVTISKAIEGLTVGHRIRSVTVRCKDHATNPRTVQIGLYKGTTLAALSLVAGTDGQSNGTGTDQNITWNLTAPETVVLGTAYVVQATAASGATGNPYVLSIFVELDYGA